MMHFPHYSTVASILLFILCVLVVKGEKYADCDNLEPNQVKILEQKQDIRVWLGSEVSLTCCMKTFPKSTSNSQLEEDFDSFTNEPLMWFDPKEMPIVNYFVDPIKAQENGVFVIPELIQKYRDVQVVHLVIKNFTTPNNGMYKCDTKNGQSADGISIIGNPKIVIDSPEYQFLEEGKTGFIKCRPRGHPKIDVVWFYEGEHLSVDDHKFSFLENHQILRIYDVKESFAGKYLCKAEVSLRDQPATLGTGSFIEVLPIQVIVYQTPTLSADSPAIKSHLKSADSTTVAVIEDGTLELSCDSKGLPPPSISWYLDNKLINSSRDPRVYITESYYRRNAYSVLKIQPVQIRDAGIYTCNSSFSAHGFSTSVAKKL